MQFDARVATKNRARTWICSVVPAVMFEMVQQASFLMLFLWLVCSRLSRQGRAVQLMMTWVWRSSPVTMLPTVRKAGTSTDGLWCLQEKNGITKGYSAEMQASEQPLRSNATGGKIRPAELSSLVWILAHDLQSQLLYGKPSEAEHAVAVFLKDSINVCYGVASGLPRHCLAQRNYKQTEA